MPAKIFYFSGTGNSLYAAKQIKAELKDAEIIPIVSVWQNKAIIPESDVMGIITPLYFGGLPKIVYEFISKINPGRAQYIFAVITAGFPATGAALSQIKELLKKKNKKLNAGFYIKMIDNYIPKFEMEEESGKMKENIKKGISFITGYIKSKRNKNRFEVSVISPISSIPWRKKVNLLDKGLYALDSCNGCGICVKVCGVNNIILENGRPHWLHNCQFCLACLHFCPQKSIQYGKTTLNKKRYHNPNITLKEMMSQK